MNTKIKNRCVTLLAREHGLASLKELQLSGDFEIVAIFTHKFNPKSYDPEQKIRDDFSDFKLFAKENHIPLFTIDSKDEKKVLEKYASENDFEFLISISWRYLIPPEIFEKAKYGSINLHRGDLPKYAGIEPIKRALMNYEKKIAICSHHVSENFDEGKVLFKYFHNVNYQKNMSLEQNIDRLKSEITVYFPKLTIKTLRYLMDDEKYEK